MSTGKTALPAVVTAQMAAFANDATLMAALPGGLWDYVPAEPTFPYACLDSATETPKDRFGSGTGSQGRVVRLSFVVFSTYQGRAEQWTIADHLIRLARHVALSIAGWEHQLSTHTGTEAFSPFDLGSLLAGMTRVTFEITVKES